MGIESALKPGDCLLYRPSGVFGRIIAIKTWHRISHVEVFIGTSTITDQTEYTSVASRDGKGVNFYQTRTSELAYILRPQASLDLAAGIRYARRLVGTPYGWTDLLNFIGFSIDAKGIVCSPFATGFYRACGFNIFPTDDINKIAPFQFLDLVGHGFEIIPIGE
jgi:hypothetical protein